MRLKVVQRFRDEDFAVVMAVPSNETERLMLRALKYEIIDRDEVFCNWHPERLGADMAVSYAKALGYKNPKFNGEDNYLTEEFCGGEIGVEITATPSNLMTIIAGYRMMGKHRKVAQILKEARRLNAAL